MSEINYSKKNGSNKTIEPDALHTKFVTLKRISIKMLWENGYWNGIVFDRSKQPEIILLVKQLLSSRGDLIRDTINNSLIVIDTEKRVDIISDQLKLWDYSGISSEEIFKDFENRNKL